MRGNMLLMSNLFNKYLPNKLNIILNRYIHKVSNINSNVSNNFIITFFIINMVLLIILFNTYIKLELANNLDDYVKVYNYLKK